MVVLLGVNMYAAMPIFASSQPAPTADMKSVNSTTYMATGSEYSSKVYEVGSESPSGAPIRKAPPSVDPSQQTEYDTENPQHGPIGDAVLPLLLFAAAAAGVITLRRRAFGKSC